MLFDQIRAELTCLLRRLAADLARPGEIYLIVTPDPIGDDMFQVRVLLPATIPADKVTSRELTVTINSGAPTVTTLAADAGQSDFFAADGDAVLVSLVDLDKAMNRSTPRTGSTTVSDTVPPHQPGELGITVIDEVPDDPVVQAKRKK